MPETITYGNGSFDANNNSFTFSDAALNASRLGLAGCGKLNAKTGLDSATVLTDSGFLIAIPEGKQIVVACIYVHLNTASDWLDVELVYTANANGTGDVVALSPKLRVETGTAAAAAAPQLTQLMPPVVVKYSATSKAFTLRAQANDSGASANLGINYWLEDIS